MGMEMLRMQAARDQANLGGVGYPVKLCVVVLTAHISELRPKQTPQPTVVRLLFVLHFQR